MKNKILTLLDKLIRIESTKDKPENLNAIIKLVIEEWGETDSYQEFAHNGIPSVVLNLNSSRSEVVFNGHADVVPARQNQFIPKIDDNKLFGRGAQDMKSGLATMLVLMRDLREKGYNFPLSLMVVTDEEIGGFNGTKKLLEQESYTPKLFIAGEPTDLKIEYEAKGPLWIKIKTHGKRAHGAYPWDGENAIVKLAKEILAINEIYPEHDEYVWKTTCNIGKVVGGEAANQVPGEAEAILDIRRVPEDKASTIVAQLKSILKYSDSEVEIILDEPTHHTDQKEKSVKLLANSIKSVTGKDAEFIQKCGASDARHYSAKGIPSVCVGPVGSGLHTDNEWVDINSLETYYRTIEKFVLDFFEGHK